MDLIKAPYPSYYGLRGAFRYQHSLAFLQIRGRSVRLESSWPCMTIGWFNITWLGLFLLLLLLTVHGSPAPLWRCAIAQLVIIGLGYVWWWLNWSLSIRP